jgi:hypothetical protein
MTLKEFRQSFKASDPPSGLSQALTSLWWDAKTDWARAHSSVMADKSDDGSWVHAYLHRKEGDTEKYSRAKKPYCKDLFEKEWLSIAQELLAR